MGKKTVLVIFVALCILFTGTVAYMDTNIADNNENIDEDNGIEDGLSEETEENSGSISGEDTDSDDDSDKPVVPADPLKRMKIVAENDLLQLYFNEETTEIAVNNKKTGDVWFSNPLGRNGDPIASGVNRLKLGSQLFITYYTQTSQQKIMDNFNDSINREQFEFTDIDNGIKVTYSLGKVEDILIIPEILSSERFEELAEKIEDPKDLRAFKRRYGLVTLDRAKNDKERAELLEEYPQLEDHDLYKLFDTKQRFLLEELEELLSSLGYTVEDMNRDHAEYNVPPKEPSKELFAISIEYTLDGDSLIASVPTSGIKYDPSFPVTQVKILEFFGAADTTEEGYIFVPDGSGALINLNNGKTQERFYNGRVYGRDYAIRAGERIENPEQVYLPVFGLKKGDKAFFAIIEEGDAFARITADISGRLNSYNTVCAEFTSLPNDTLDLSEVAGNNIIKAYQSRMYKGNFKIRYAFLSGDKANYSGMAEYYRNYLIEKGLLKPIESPGDIPFYLELVGAIEKVKPFFGFPVTRLEALTTYMQAQKILEKLMSNDINNIKLKYNGWFNGGIEHQLANKIKLNKQLGGKKGFKRLVDFLNQNNIEFFPDVSFEYALNDKMFDGFSARANGSRFIDKEVAVLYNFNPATFLDNISGKPRFLVSPNNIGSITDKFLKKYNKLNINGLSLRTMGSHLSSNFKEKNLIDRQEAQVYIGNELNKFKDKDIDIMLNGANAYALPYSKYIVNSPIDYTSFKITDESIPFYQMVIRGYIEYAGEPINLASDYKRTILKTIETGSGIYFKWIYEDNSLVKDSDYNELFSVNYEKWLEDAVSFYAEANSVLKSVSGQKITNHEILAENVSQVTYENGTRVIVNYNKNSVTHEGLTIDPESYRIFQEVN